MIVVPSVVVVADVAVEMFESFVVVNFLALHALHQVWRVLNCHLLYSVVPYYRVYYLYYMTHICC